MKHLDKISFVLLVAIVAYIATKELSSNSVGIGVIEMEDLVYQYQGMKDATLQYEKQVSLWENQSDSIENQLKSIYDEIALDSINGNKEKLKSDQQHFYYLQKSYYSYKQKISDKAQQDDRDMTVAVLNQLKEHMAGYATENNIEIIISNTQLQNVGFANQKNDITKEVLAYANKKYSGE